MLPLIATLPGVERHEKPRALKKKSSCNERELKMLPLIATLPGAERHEKLRA